MIKVLIVDDQNLVREGGRIVLGRATDLSVVGDADNGRSAVQLAGELSPEVVLMDITMPGMNGIPATQQIVDGYPAIRVLILSVHKEARFVSRALKAGASGYLIKECGSEEVVDAIRAVHAGQLYLCRQAMQAVVGDYVRLIPDAPFQADLQAGPPLTLREREILQLIAEGNNAKSIAFTLDLNVKTVDSYRKQIMKKLNLFSIAELTKYAVRHGISSMHS